jgi:hypothetical protein
VSTTPFVVRPAAGRLRTIARRLACVLALGALAATVGAGAVSSPAGAADDTTSTTTPSGGTANGTVTSSFALAPTGTDPSQPSTRPNLTYSLAPGAAIQDSVTLWNYSDIPLDFDVYATDALNTSAGGFDVLPGDKKPTDAGSWVTLAQHKVTVPPRSSLEIPLAVTVPSGARPGDHTAGIIASSKTPGTDAEGHHIVFDRRTGSRLYLRVTGPVNPAIVVEDVSADYHPAVNPLDGSVDVAYTVRNTGNVRLGAHQKIAVDDLFGTVDERKIADIPELLPGSSLTYHRHFTGVAATLRVSADVTVTPFAPKSTDEALPKGAEATTASAHAWAIPWTLLLLLLVIAVVTYLVRRARRNRERAGSGGPNGGGGGQGGGLAAGPTNGHAAQPVLPVGATRIRAAKRAGPTNDGP